LDTVNDLARTFSAPFFKVVNELDPLIRRAYATNTTLGATNSADQLSVAMETGVSMAELSKEVLELREQGIQTLNRSTLSLIARFKASDQNAKALTTFIAQNSVVLRLNSMQSQVMAQDLSQFALKFQQRQDTMLALAGAISQNFRVQTAQGSGQSLTAAFTKFGATLGDRATKQVEQLTKFFGGDDLPTLIRLGLEDMEGNLAGASTDKEQMDIIVKGLATASKRIEEQLGGRGAGSVNTTQSKAILDSMFGGTGILVIQELNDAVRDQKTATDNVIENLISLRSAGSAVQNALMEVIYPITKLVTEFPNATKGVITALTVYGAATVLLRIMLAGLTQAVKLNTIAEQANAAGGAVGRLGSVLGFFARMIPLFVGLSVATGVIAGVTKAMSDDTKEINNKTPDLDRGAGSGGLRTSILSDLSNITNRLSSTGMNARQIEILGRIATNTESMVNNGDNQRSLPATPGRKF
jgi:hypothetical protein